MSADLTIAELERRALCANTASGKLILKQIIAVFKERDELKAQLGLVASSACRCAAALNTWMRFASECNQRNITVPLWAAMLNREAVNLTLPALAEVGPCQHRSELLQARKLCGRIADGLENDAELLDEGGYKCSARSCRMSMAELRAEAAKDGGN